MEFGRQAGALTVLGVKLVGVNAENVRKLLLTIAFVLVLTLLVRLLRALSRKVLRDTERHRARFWTRQIIAVVGVLLLVLGLVSIWFDDPGRLTTALGLFSAGLAFALQRVVTAAAGYILILRGRTFTVGDRIVMGGVRGDVVALGFMQTTIMEMGQPPPVQADDPAVWVHSRQYTGRIVTVSNARVFDEPVYNYTREFPFIWEEMQIPFSYGADRARAETILLEAARRHTVQAEEVGAEALSELQRRYFMEDASLDPKVYWRLTDNWLELTVRFLVREHGTRQIKDRMTRDILKAFDDAGLGIGSSTLEITAFPQVQIQRVPRQS